MCMKCAPAAVLLVALAAPAAAQGKLPPADAAALQKHITTDSPYQEWQLWPGKGKLYEGTEPHGALLTTYVNDVALKGIRSGARELPAGSIIVKENYSPNKDLMALTTMYKVQGFAPHHGDWFWLKSSPGGEIQAAGAVEGCIGCHAKAAEKDWLFTERPAGR
jgi:hypothetical protein